MKIKKNDQPRREFLKTILRTTVFSGLIGIGIITTNKKDGASTKTGLCLRQRCGRCSLLANCNLTEAASFKNSTEKSRQESNTKTGKPQ